MWRPVARLASAGLARIGPALVRLAWIWLARGIRLARTGLTRIGLLWMRLLWMRLLWIWLLWIWLL